jgi:hypothetical protein
MKDVWVLRLGFNVLMFKFYGFRSDFWGLGLGLGFLSLKFLGLSLLLTFSSLKYLGCLDLIFVIGVSIFRFEF